MSRERPSRARLLDEQANFAAWKEKKDEEARAVRRLELERKRAEEEEVHSKRVNGRQAYVQWKAEREQRLQREADERRKRVNARAFLESEQQQTQQQQCQRTYQEWRKQKEWERRELRSGETTRTTPSPRYSPHVQLPSRAPTQSYGSFCSVWGPDLTLANRLERRSPRPNDADVMSYVLRQRTLPGGRAEHKQLVIRGSAAVGRYRTM